VFDEPKSCLQGRRFSSDEIVKAEIRKWFGEQNDFFYSLGLEDFIVSCDKCLKMFGDYLDKSRAGIETLSSDLLASTYFHSSKQHKETYFLCQTASPLRGD